MDWKIHHETHYEDLVLFKYPVDFLFIDGDHTYESVRKDFETYSPWSGGGGHHRFHDICPDPPDAVGGVPSFWKETMGKYRNMPIIKDQSQGGCGIGILFSGDPVLYPLYRVDDLRLGIRDPDVVLEALVDGDLHVLLDCQA